MRSCVLRCLPSLVLIALCVPSPVQGQQRIRSVTVHTQWGGLGTSRDTTVVIDAKGTGFTLRGQAVEARLVSAVVSALISAVVPEPTLSSLGITETWLKTNLAAHRQDPDATASQRRLFESAFTNPEHVAKVLPGLFRFSRTDDYPGVSIEVLFEDGSKVSAESSSNYPFMLPWKVGGGVDTYNSDISRAIAALLPPDTVNKERLAGSQFASELAESVMRSIEREYKLRGADDRVGAALR